MNTYIQKKAKYYGIQYTGDNREKIIDALRIDKQYCQQWHNEDTGEVHLLIDAPGYNLGKIAVKEWILIAVDRSNYAVVAPRIFVLEYEEIV